MEALPTALARQSSLLVGIAVLVTVMGVGSAVLATVLAFLLGVAFLPAIEPFPSDPHPSLGERRKTATTDHKPTRIPIGPARLVDAVATRIPDQARGVPMSPTSMGMRNSTATSLSASFVILVLLLIVVVLRALPIWVDKRLAARGPAIPVYLIFSLMELVVGFIYRRSLAAKERLLAERMETVLERVAQPID